MNETPIKQHLKGKYSTKIYTENTQDTRRLFKTPAKFSKGKRSKGKRIKGKYSVKKSLNFSALKSPRKRKKSLY